MSRPAVVAAALAGAGVAVFPLLPGKKTPATVHGVRQATAEPGQVRAWWAFNGAFNVGLATGPSGLVVLDCDAGKPWPAATPPPAGVSDGSDVLCMLAERCGVSPGSLFRTAAVRTPSGGYHYYYRARAGRAIRCSAGKVAPWVDVRSAGGYVVAPGSALPVGRYVAEYGFDELQSGIDAEPLPDWLADLLDPPVTPRDEYQWIADRLDRQASGEPGYLAAALAGEVDRVARAATGTRNATLNEAAFRLGTLADAGLDVVEASAALQSAALAVGLAELEAARTFASGWAGGTAHPRTVPQ